MKTRTFSFASCLAVLALAVISFASCSKDKDEEPSIDEILSEETTPVTFEFPAKLDLYDRYIMFDYAGNHFLSSDSTRYSQRTIDMRQGKHHILWFDGLDEEQPNPAFGIIPDEEYYSSGVHFDPATQTCTVYDENGKVEYLAYYEKELEIYPYLLPTQKISFGKHITCDISIKITDKSDRISQPTESKSPFYHGPTEYIGEIEGIPFVKAVSVTGKTYQLKQGGITEHVYTYIPSDYYRGNKIVKDGYDYYIGNWSGASTYLCPLNGLDNVQLTARIRDKAGNAIPTTILPKISLRRGYTTVLTGPLFSGSTSDWIVTMKEWK